MNAPDVLPAPPGAAGGVPPVGAATPNAVLELRNVTKLFGEFKAVDDVSFSLAPGCICGFLGPNGAGKTTTIRMILDILKPTSGTLNILGHASALDVRQRLGYLPEEKGLYKKMKTWSVIAYFATLKGMTRAAAKKRAYELLERHGLKDFAEKPTDALSKGMGQKVQMLASLAHDPEFLILDEPFSGLDPVNQQVMEDIIREATGRNRTVLFSTHVMQHAERLCDRIVLLARGRKIFDGSISQAKRMFPRRVRIETVDAIAPLRELREVAAVSQVAVDGDAASGRQLWELELREEADPQAVLQACFAEKIRLHSFTHAEPTLHEVFVRLVGPDGAKHQSR
jgi:ABC-2 type transport system ATP-binding protein